MKFYTILTTLLTICIQCQAPLDKEALKREIFKTEKDFERMTSERSIAEAFYYFADANAVIKRGNDSLIAGKEHIKTFYEQSSRPNTSVSWTPDYIEVSTDGNLAYTYGKYVWKSTNKNGVISENKGIFHTVWKRQSDGSWKYVWD